MQKSNKVLQILGIPHSALISVIFAMMAISFPLGAYVVFNSGVEDKINFDYPMKSFHIFLAGIDYEIPIQYELGDAFIVLWSVYLILFTIAIFGPKQNFMKNISEVLSRGQQKTGSNYIVTTIQWFTILVIVSGIINFVQEGVGISTEPPVPINRLTQFFDVTAAPLVEEIGFRVMLIGIPLFLLFSRRPSAQSFFKALWHPKQTLQISDYKRPIILIVIVSLFFGFAHIFAGEPWSIGKLAQASVSGIIIGWVYFRYGFAPAILIHWATNYFIFSYVFTIAAINEMSITSAFSHSLTNSLELILIVTGAFSAAVLLINNYSKRKQTLQI